MAIKYAADFSAAFFILPGSPGGQFVTDAGGNPMHHDCARYRTAAALPLPLGEVAEQREAGEGLEAPAGNALRSLAVILRIMIMLGNPLP